MPQVGRKPPARMKIPAALLAPAITRDATPPLTLTPGQTRRQATATAVTKALRGGKNKQGRECRWGVGDDGWCKQAPIRPDTVVHLVRYQNSGGGGTPKSGLGNVVIQPTISLPITGRSRVPLPSRGLVEGIVGGVGKTLLRGAVGASKLLPGAAGRVAKLLPRMK